MDELTGVFVQESREQLAEMEAGLLALEAGYRAQDEKLRAASLAHGVRVPRALYDEVLALAV